MMKDRKCSREGCEHRANTRGMCAAHYRHWQRVNPSVQRQDRDEGRNAIIDAMPGTAYRLTEKTGLAYEWVLVLIQRMREDPAVIFIADWLPPAKIGSRWVAVYDAKITGLEKDKPQPSKRKKKALVLEKRRQKHAIKMKKRAGTPPLASPFDQLLQMAA